MDYQLILQFKGDSLENYDGMVALENDLLETLDGIAEIDGHDAGSGQTNIFITTSDPEPAFDRAKIALERHGLLTGVAAAYRPVGAAAFTILWPRHLQSFSVA